MPATTGRLRESLVERDRLLAERHAALRAWDEFLDSAAHELRTPVAALQLQLQSLELLVSGSRQLAPAIFGVQRGHPEVELGAILHAAFLEQHAI